MTSIINNEKLSRLASDFGVSNEQYFEMIRREVVIDGVILWCLIALFMGVFLVSSIGLMKDLVSKNKTIFSRFDELFIGASVICGIASLALMIGTWFYTIPLNKTFNTDYVVIKEIHESYNVQYGEKEEPEDEEDVVDASDESEEKTKVIKIKIGD